MTEPGPFAPPTPPTPQVATPSVLPPPTGAPIGSSPLPSVPSLPAGPPPSRRPRWLIPVIVGGSMLLIGLIAGVAVVAVQLATWVSDRPVVAAPPAAGGPGQAGEPDDLVGGEPGDPVASEPFDCVTCFASEDVARIEVPSGAYARLGLPVVEGKPFEIAMFDDQRDYVDWWEDDGGSPEHCYFTYTQPPLLFEPERDGIANSDLIRYAPARSDADGAYSLGDASRIFVTHTAASAHMVELEAAVLGCTEYALTGAGYAAEVTPAPAFEVPADVAAYGWVETAGVSRYYAADVQRGNVITRLSLFSDSQGPSEQQFRTIVEEYARALAALEL